MPPIRIIYFINNLRVGGAQRYLVDCVKHVDHKGFSVEIVNLGAGSDFGNEIAVPVLELGADLSTRNPFKLVQLVKHLQRVRPHILHTHLRYADTLGQWIGYVLGLHTVTTIHGIVEFPRHHRSLLSRVEDAGIRRAARVIAVSEGVRQHVIEERHVPARHVELLPAATDLSPFAAAASRKQELRTELGIRDDAIVFACTAQFRPEKRHDLLLRDFEALLRATSRPVMLRLIGDGGALRDDIANRIARSGLQESVSICSGTRSDVARWLGSADVFVSYSESEGTSLAVAEGMAAGLPALLPRRDYFTAQVGEGREGLFFAFDDTQDFIAQACRLIEYSALRARLAHSALLRARAMYDIPAHVIRLQNIYQSILHR